MSADIGSHPMADTTHKPTDRDSPQATTAAENLTKIADAARTFRRARGDERYGSNDIRTICHQGPSRTEMLTWESRRGAIVRQELRFFAYVVEYRDGKALATGRIDQDNQGPDGSSPADSRVRLDPQPVRTTLEYASHLLKNAPDRDYYGQHLLKQVNDALNTGFADRNRTVVAALDRYAKHDDPTAVGTTQISYAPSARAAKHTRVLVVAMLVLASCIFAAGVRLLLW